MTCIVLVQNPSGAVMPITDGEDYGVPPLAQYDTPEEAKAAMHDQPLVRAWGGYVVDLDNLDVTLI